MARVFSLFANVTKGNAGRKSYLKKRDTLAVMRLRNMLEKKRLLNVIEKMKLKQQIESLKKKGKPMVTRFMQPIAEPFFANPHTNNDLNTAFNADIGHGDSSLFGGENYYDENFYDEDFYTEDYFGNIGINWFKLRTRDGNPLFY